jgi:hypothetical protein
MAYQPNFNDPRVITRVRHAYGFTRAVMSTTKPTRWSQSAINRYLGHQTNKLGKYLREILLITTDHHYSMDTGLTKEYLLNEVGLNFLRHQLTTKDNKTFAQWAQNNDVKNVQENNSNSYPSVIHLFDEKVVSEWANREYGDELKNLSFKYEDKSNRLWHPLQNIKRMYKPKILSDAGLKYHYDINTAAPTLLMRKAQMMGMENWPTAIHNYIQFKSEIRDELARQLDMPAADVKIAINALFCGARLGNNNEFALYRLLGSKHRVDLLRNNKFIQELRADISACWQTIQVLIPRKTITDKNGKERLIPVSSKQKWNIYFELERSVLNAVKKYLSMTGNRHFLEHDGWSTEHPIDMDELINFVYQETGFKITISIHTLV